MCRSRGANATGHSLVEVMIALLVMAIIGGAAISLFVAQSRLARRIADRSESIAAVRTAAAILTWELRSLSPAHDATAFATDSMRTRVFRGIALACAHDATSVHIRYAGLRAPEPAKDSLLLLARTAEHAVGFRTARAPAVTRCTPQPGETVLAIEPDSVLAVDDVALVFERGEYHLSGSALRYRHGAGGRQPLTAEVLHDDSTDLQPQVFPRLAQPETVALRVRLATVEITTPATPRIWPIRLPFLNTRVALDSLSS